MLQVKIFNAKYPSELETGVNNWLKEKQVNVHSTTFQIDSDNQAIYPYYFVVTYEE